MNEGKKLISIVVPVYNEEQNIPEVYRRVFAVVDRLPAYEFELVFFDDGSTDSSRACIESLCEKDLRVKAVFYAGNHGYIKTILYCMQQAKGDAAILLHADLQNPPEEIPRLIEKWEGGADAVLGVKNRSRENRLMFFLRTLGYLCLRVFFGVRMIPHATEFELLDRGVLEKLRQVRTQNPFLRGLVLDYARDLQTVFYTQDRRARGRSKFNFSKYYEFAIGAIVNSSKCLPRRFLIAGCVGLLLTGAELCVFFLPRAGGLSPMEIANGLILRGILAAVLLLLVFACFAAEYLIALIGNATERPFVTEERRIHY